MITFNDEEDVINPEDIDPSIGETTLILIARYNKLIRFI